MERHFAAYGREVTVQVFQEDCQGMASEKDGKFGRVVTATAVACHVSMSLSDR